MKKLNRREFVTTGTAAGMAAATGTAFAAPVAKRRAPEMLTPQGVKPLVISDYSGFGYRNGGTMNAVEKAFDMIVNGEDVLDALIAGVNIPENDPTETGIGYGGLPNERGVVQLDACCMHGPKKRAGCVAALEGVRTPSLVAKAVADYTDHHLLVGQGAQDFARNMGFEIEDDLNTERSREIWLEWRRRVDPEHYLDPEDRPIRKRGSGMEDPGTASQAEDFRDRRLARLPNRPRHGSRRAHPGAQLLGNDQLQWYQRRRRDLRRHHHERVVVEDPRARRRLADSRRRPVRRWRRGRLWFYGAR